MSYFHRPDAQLDEPDEMQDPPRSPFADVAGRVANWFAGTERPRDEALESSYEPEPDPDPFRELTAGADSGEPSRFPVAPFGYNRAVVDEHLFGLERELAELRAQRQPEVSVTEELERIGEQTASILVVAHDQAHETTRLAQEQAERCVNDAAANAVAITTEAKERLRELDGETDSVWRERERLLEDVRAVSSALASLADQASERFPAAPEAPAAPKAPEAPVAQVAQVAPVAPESRVSRASATPRWQGSPMDAEPQATEPFRPISEPGSSQSFARSAHTGDTGAFLAGFEPPDM
jgi:hypothetical protein